MAAAGGFAGRIARAWRRLPGDQKLAAGSALGLVVSMVLPWYQLTTATAKGLDSTNLSAFGDFSFVEAAVLLVAAGVLFLLFSRAEGRAFHLPGGDGSILLAAGIWTTALLVWRAFDKPNTQAATAIGLQWGFVFAFASSGFLTYAGFRVRAAHRAEPPLPGDDEATERIAGPPPPPPAGLEPETAPTVRRAPDFHDAPTERGAAPDFHDAPTQRGATPDFSDAPTERRPAAYEEAPTERVAPDPGTTPTVRRRPPAPEPDRWDRDLTLPHGSEEPLPRDDR